MNKDNIYIGSEFNNQEKKVLILGESFYSLENKLGEPVDKGFAQKIVNNSAQGIQYFTSIAKAFDYDNCKDFFDKVCFGNYANVYCDTHGYFRHYANTKITKELNKELFDIINEYEIDIVITFSLAAYYHLPSLNKESTEAKKEYCHKIQQSYSKKNFSITKYEKEKMHRKIEGTPLNKYLIVFGFPHISAKGHPKVELYTNIIKESKETECIHFLLNKEVLI